MKSKGYAIDVKSVAEEEARVVKKENNSHRSLCRRRRAAQDQVLREGLLAGQLVDGREGGVEPTESLHDQRASCLSETDASVGGQHETLHSDLAVHPELGIEIQSQDLCTVRLEDS